MTSRELHTCSEPPTTVEEMQKLIGKTKSNKKKLVQAYLAL